jgi:flagellar basal body-associated protein FliL|tara:strand:+ start:824 stop:994 length:171 start_codon:yes stop_codon:yes gene_type:complete
MIKSKRGSAWIWILIIFILVVIGVVAYFVLSGGDTTPGVNAGINAGASIPKPPALP